MALLDDLAKDVSPAGLATGIGAALLMPILAPVASGVLRPAAKAMMRTGITLYRTTLEPIGAAVGDLVTEAQLELATAQVATPPPASAKSDNKSDHPKPSRAKRRVEPRD